MESGARAAKDREYPCATAARRRAGRGEQEQPGDASHRMVSLRAEPSDAREREEALGASLGVEPVNEWDSATDAVAAALLAGARLEGGPLPDVHAPVHAKAREGALPALRR